MSRFLALPSSTLALALAFALAALFPSCTPSCAQQYLAVPGATVVPDAPPRATDETPVVTLLSGGGNAAVGSTTEVHVDFTSVTSIDVTELVFFIAPLANFEVTLTDEELEQGFADLELLVLAEPPPEEICFRDYRGNGTCYAPADEGVTGAGARVQNDEEGSTVGLFDFFVEPVAGDETGTCQTYEECCGCVADPNLPTNRCPLECYETAVCGCPAGTSDIGARPDGTLTCDCPN